MTQGQFDTITAHFRLNESRHIWIKRIHELFWTLNNGYVNAQFPQVFSQFQTDKSTTGKDN